CKGSRPGRPCVPDLCSELCLSRHLLEQSPSLVPCRPSRERRNALGKPAPALLAVARTIRHALACYEPLSDAACRRMLRCLPRSGLRLLHPHSRPAPDARQGLTAGEGTREGR